MRDARGITGKGYWITDGLHHVFLWWAIYTWRHWSHTHTVQTLLNCFCIYTTPATEFRVLIYAIIQSVSQPCGSSAMRKSMMHAKSFRLSFTSYINVEKNHHQWPNVLLTRERPDRFKLAARLRWLKYSFLLVFLTWWAGKHPWGGWSSIAAEDCVDFHSLSRIWRYSWTFEDWKNTATRLADCMTAWIRRCP